MGNNSPDTPNRYDCEDEDTRRLQELSNKMESYDDDNYMIRDDDSECGRISTISVMTDSDFLNETGIWTLKKFLPS
jgi:hypothetical protein